MWPYNRIGASTYRSLANESITSIFTNLFNALISDASNFTYIRIYLVSIEFITRFKMDGSAAVYNQVSSISSSTFQGTSTTMSSNTGFIVMYQFKFEVPTQSLIISSYASNGSNYLVYTNKINDTNPNRYTHSINYEIVRR